MKKLIAIIMTLAISITAISTSVLFVSASDNYSIVKKNGRWICVDKTGKMNKTANGIYKNKYGWWKTTNGLVTFKETGIFKNEYGWWRVVNSKVDFEANGIYKNQYGWWKTTNGKVTFKENGVFKNSYGWWRVEKSKVNFNANSIYKNQYGWWKTTNGKVTFDETGIFKNDYGTWYVENSKVDFRKNGKVTYNGNTYQVTDGKAKPIGIETAKVSFKANATDVTNMPEDVNVIINELVAEPSEPRKEGYYFVGWFVDSTGTEKYNFSLPITDNLVLYAKWINENDNLNDDIIDRGDIEILEDEGAIDVTYNESGTVLTVVGRLTKRKVLTTEDASEVLNSARTLFGSGFNASSDEIIVKKIKENTDQEESFYKFSPSINDVRVEDSQVILSTDNSGTVNGLFNSYIDKIEYVDTNPAISAREAEQTAIDYLLEDDSVKTFLDHVTQESSKNQDEIVDYFKSTINPESELVIALNDDDEPTLAYAVSITVDLSVTNTNDENDVKSINISKKYYIGANESAGSLIKINNNNKYVTVSAPDLLNKTRSFEATRDGDKYLLKDNSRKVETYNVKIKRTLNWDKIDDPAFGFITTTAVYPGDIVSFNRIPSKTEVSVHSNMSKVYDYYHNVLDRDSFDGKGGTIKATIHNSLFQTPNAAWSHEIKQMAFFSNKLCSCLDVIAHEFTHGVISYVVGDDGNNGMAEKGEPGALEESYADIMGCLIEGKEGKDKWLLGEDYEIKYNMAKPSESNFPEHYKDYNKNSDVHLNSSIFSYAAYKMMTDSRTTNISSETWANVFYASLNDLTTTASFLHAREAILKEAIIYQFGNNQIQAIIDAFDDVGINGSNDIRIVLTWGEEPHDLDSHLIGPYTTQTDNYHIYFSNMYAYSDDNELLVKLDYDDTSSFGPEVVTIYKRTPGKYYYYVHDYTNNSSASSSALSKSAAFVRIYDNNKLLTKYLVDPQSSGTYWDVFELVIHPNGSISVSPINKYGSVSSF